VAQPSRYAGNWTDPLSRAVGVLVDGAADPDRDQQGRPLVDDDLLLLVNGWWGPLSFTLPDGDWRLLLDTYDGTAHPTASRDLPSASPVVPVRERSLALLARPRPATRRSPGQ
jgi:isoamylase